MPVYVARKLGDAGETRRLLARACAGADVLIAWGIPRLAAVTHDLPLPVIDVSHSDGAVATRRRWFSEAAGGADFHVAVSRCALAAFPPEVRSRATVIYNGAEIDRLAPRRPTIQQRRDWGVSTGDRVALFLGRFDDVKGPLRLVRLPWNICRPTGTWCFTATVRSGKNCWPPRRWRATAAACSPPLTHVGDALAAADVLVMPSQFEGMPLALVEAWLAGLPAVTTPIGFVHEAERRHGPLCELVPHEPTGEQLARGILRAARADARRAGPPHRVAALHRRGDGAAVGRVLGGRCNARWHVH